MAKSDDNRRPKPGPRGGEGPKRKPAKKYTPRSRDEDPGRGERPKSFPGKPREGDRTGRGRPGAFAGKSREAAPERKSDPEEIRLNRYIANAGICSRREADTFIAAGNVTVNGKVVNAMGYKVKRTDEVRFDGKRLNLEKKEYVLLNKPKNFITTTSDEKGRRTVMELISSAS